MTVGAIKVDTVAHALVVVVDQIVLTCAQFERVLRAQVGWLCDTGLSGQTEVNSLVTVDAF